MQNKIKTTLIQTAKVLFSISLIVWLVTSGRLDFRALTKLLEPTYLIPGILCVGLAIFIGSQRWRRLLRSQDLKISFSEVLKLNLIANFFNFAVPGGVGGDLVKGYYISRSNPHAKLKSAVTVLVDRLIGLLAMSLMALVMMIYRWDLIEQKPELRLTFYIIALVNFGSFVVWAHIFSHRLYELGWIEKILHYLPKKEALLRTYHTVTNYRHSKEIFLPTLFLSFSAQFMSVLFFVCAGKGLGYDIPITAYFAAVPITFMVQSIPLSPAGVGVGQAASFVLFNLMAPGSGPLGAASTTAYQIVQFMFGLCGAYFYLGISKKLKNSNPATPQTEENR